MRYFLNISIIVVSRESTVVSPIIVSIIVVFTVVVSIIVVLGKGIYNRLPLMMSYLLDIDLAL